MDDAPQTPPVSPDVKSVLPDVVHTKQIPASETDVGKVTLEISETTNVPNETATKLGTNDVVVTEISEAESISEHIPFEIEQSLSTSENVAKPEPHLLNVEGSTEKASRSDSLNIPHPQSATSDQPSAPQHSSEGSWPTDVNIVSDIHHISVESPAILAPSSDSSKAESESKISTSTPNFSEHKSDDITPKNQILDKEGENESLRSEYLDSLNEDKSDGQLNVSLDRDPSLERQESSKDSSSGSEDVIKLDIRGSGIPKFPFQTEKIIFGPPPEGIIVEPNTQTMPVFKNLLSPFLVTATDHITIQEVFGVKKTSDYSPPEKVPQKLLDTSPEQSFEQKDLLIEELLVEETKDKDDLIIKDDEESIRADPVRAKSLAPDETGSYSTMTTDYKTICEEYHSKFVHLEDAITQRDQLIEGLTVSLQHSVKERDVLKTDNAQLSDRVQALQQHLAGENSQSNHDTVQAHLSDFAKYESMLKDDSTKFYSAVMSSGASSVKSSNGERDMDREEITIHYSRSDLKSSDTSDDLQNVFETKLMETLQRFDVVLAADVKNKVTEGLVQVFCNEVGRLRMEYDTELRDVEGQMQRERQAAGGEARRLRDLLSSVRTGNADIDALRQQLETKHEKEMENLRTYFEKKCSDMERSYSEEVWRERCASGAQSPEVWHEAAGDAGRRRTRSADLPSLTAEGCGSVEQALRQARLKHEQHLDQIKCEHVAHVTELQTRHREAITLCEEQASHSLTLCGSVEQALRQARLKHEQHLDQIKCEHVAHVTELQTRHREAITLCEEQASHSLTLCGSVEQALRQARLKHEQHLDQIKCEHVAHVTELQTRHREAITLCEEQASHSLTLCGSVEQALRQARLKHEQHLDQIKCEHVAHVTELQTRRREAITLCEEQASHSLTLCGSVEQALRQARLKHEQHLDQIKCEHVAHVTELQTRHREAITLCEEQASHSLTLCGSVERALRQARLKHEQHLDQIKCEHVAHVTELQTRHREAITLCEEQASHSLTLCDSVEQALRQARLKHEQHLDQIKCEHVAHVTELQTRHREAITLCEEQASHSLTLCGSVEQALRQARLKHELHLDQIKCEHFAHVTELQTRHREAITLCEEQASHSLTLCGSVEQALRQARLKHEQHLDQIKCEHVAHVTELQTRHREAITLCEEQASHSLTLCGSVEQALRQARLKHEQHLDQIKCEHVAHVTELQTRHREAITLCEEQASHSLTLCGSVEQALRQARLKHEQHLDQIKCEHVAHVTELQTRHREAITLCEEQASHALTLCGSVEQALRQARLKHEQHLDQIKCEHVAHVTELQTRHREAITLCEEQASHALTLCGSVEQALRQARLKHEQHLDQIKCEHVAHVTELQTRHREAITLCEEQIKELKAHIQTVQNTESGVSLYQQDIDLELEKRAQDVTQRAQLDIIQQMQDQIQVLLCDPDAELSSWPLDLVALRDKIHGDAITGGEKEVSSPRDELPAGGGGGGSDTWKRRRNLSFDQNRHIQEVTKERDGLKRVAVTLQRVVGQLVAYCVAAEDELNKTVLGELLAQLAPGDTRSVTLEECDSELDISRVSRTSRHVHFAPDLDSILAELDEDDLVGYLQQQRDLSVEIKRELEHSLSRLRHEAHELLQLSTRVPSSNRSVHAAEDEPTGAVRITELVHEIDSKICACDTCHLHKKSMEEAVSETRYLRAELDSAMMRIADLSAPHDTEIIAEGFGCAPQSPAVWGGSSRVPPRSPPESRSHSLDGCVSPRYLELQRMARDLELVTRERDDLQQQLEAANRQLRATRQFLEEQGAEREAERDEFANTLSALREDNNKLVVRLQNNARILNEVEQLEAQTREMTQMISELEERKSSADGELRAALEKVTVLRDVIADLEHQLENKATRETDILEQLETMRQTIDERDSNMRELLRELEALRSERDENSVVACVKCSQGVDDTYAELVERIKEQAARLEVRVHRRTHVLERMHEVCSRASCSEPSEELSQRDLRDTAIQEASRAPGGECTARSPRTEPLPELRGVWGALEALCRAEDAALKRIQDLEMQRASLRDVAQEVRAERDVLQARMSEQALKISSLSARLDQQRHHAEALAHDATSHLSVQLHDATAEVQRLQEELVCKEKQLTRLRQSVDERDKISEHNSLYGNMCNPNDKVMKLERELSSAQSRLAQLEADTMQLQAKLHEKEVQLQEKEVQLQELLALRLQEDAQRREDVKCDVIADGKTSARTLSDIVSISSELDEQDVQMRRAELRATRDLDTTHLPPNITPLHKTLTPALQKANMSSLNIDLDDYSELAQLSPRADSLPICFTSTQNRDASRGRYRRNVNEMTVFGSVGGGGDIPDNCSLYPNRDVSDNKNVSVEPKKIDFSLEPSNDNKTLEDLDYTSLKELGINLDVTQSNFVEILTQLKREIKKNRSELDACKAELGGAEEQLREFEALKAEVEELKTLLESTVETMRNDKTFYETQLDHSTSNKKLLEQRLSELTKEVNEKSNDLHLLKEDILRREDMVLELAKDKRNLTNKIAELQVKIDELQSRNLTLEKYESENHQMREKIADLQKLEQLVSEKNQQIDSLNQHLDRLDDLQRRLSDKTEQLEHLKEAFEEKSNELFQMQDTVEALNRDLANVHEDNSKLNLCNKELKLKLTKLEKEHENQSLKLQTSDQRVSSLNGELTSKIEELKLLTDKLKDKETEIEILNEDINFFHEEIASLKEQLKMVSRSPSPRSKEDRSKPLDRQANKDKKQLTKIKKEISLMQYELDFIRKDLNHKVFDLAKAKLDITELQYSLSEASKQASDRESENKVLSERSERLQHELHQLGREKEQLAHQLALVVGRIREESSLEDLRRKLDDKAEECLHLERELAALREFVQRLQPSERRGTAEGEGEERVDEGEAVEGGERALVLSGTRSPTAELERAVRDQLDYSHRLDEHIMEQILSASSDNDDIPRLALNSSNRSTSSGQSAHGHVTSDGERLVSQLEARLRDKETLITELNNIRDQLSEELQAVRLRCENERDNSLRLQLLLDTQRDTADTLQHQDSNMIHILKKRLESSMRTELELQQAVQRHRTRVALLERQLHDAHHAPAPPDSPLRAHLQLEVEEKERLRGELATARARADSERARAAELHARLDQLHAHYTRTMDAKRAQCDTYRAELAELRRLKQMAGVELLRAKELLSVRLSAIQHYEKALAAGRHPDADTSGEMRESKNAIAREIRSLTQCLAGGGGGGAAGGDERDDVTARLRRDNQQLADKVALLTDQLAQQRATPAAAAVSADEKDQAIRFLQGRVLRLESCRKALVWQKRYQQGVLAGYYQLERALRPAGTLDAPRRPAGRRRFKCTVLLVVVVVRMRYLVRRRHQVRQLSAGCLLRASGVTTSAPPPAVNIPTSVYLSTSPPSRERAAPRPAPLGRAAPPPPRDSLARRLLHHDLRLNMPASPSIGEQVLSPRLNTASPRGEPFILNPERVETPNTTATRTAYLSKLELVSRCLNQAIDSSRDVP